MPYVLGAAIIAVFACTIALSIFFFFKSKWTNKWHKRIGCAVLLAAGVSGMHWCATAGTSYKLISLTPSKELSPDRVINAVTVLVGIFNPCMEFSPDHCAGYLLLLSPNCDLLSGATLKAAVSRESKTSCFGMCCFRFRRQTHGQLGGIDTLP